ncbi:uncharacterized protein ColSpa_01463 [Colletotrichum spaethianum]|uniref:WSC domain-containing protein n=1 Tax=Colletotrichum spaethianum TaxID=700344 RepID=A0AA37L7V6_9PEZI|nr:uncharacterized protein ColSpa_01463 [Colletotrichum spaethianum]GKT41283.1 hypothetical protein ColSpa_01463 [Colletotrichum spaethianum]
MRSIAFSALVGQALVGGVMGQFTNTTTTAAPVATPPPSGYAGGGTLAYSGTVPFGLIRTIATGQAINVQFGDQTLLLTSLGCKVVPPGQSPFVATGAFSPDGQSDQSCVTACLAGFPTFTLTLSAEVMTIDRCIAACTVSKRYAAVFGNDCFCGDFVDDVNEVKAPEEQCNIPCPGNSAQRCGGRASAPLLKRQLPGVIASDIRFTIYVNPAVNATVPGASGSTTSVVTTTVSGTVTVVTTVVPTGLLPTGGLCANGKCGNIPCFGDDCYKVIVGYGEFCGFDYTCIGPDCLRRLVCNDGVWRPEACNGYDCGRKIVCTSGKCKYVTIGMAEYDQKITCYGNFCKVEACTGDLCNKKYVCADGSCTFQTCPFADAGKKFDCTGDNCTIVKTCDVCPTPAPPCEKCVIVIPRPPVTTTACNGSVCTTVTISPPAITKTPYQTEPPVTILIPSLPPAVGTTRSQLPPTIGTGISISTPTTVVTAGTSKLVASFGALAFSVMAAALLL